ncbi:MAG: N-acetylmuramoyl-L-alanine amidase [Glaciecola sp.]|jgi:N-acetylmuramoyl-L-alanine amidase
MNNKHFLFTNKNLANKKTVTGLVIIMIASLLFGFNVDENETYDDVKVLRKVMIDAGHGGHDPGNLCTKRYDETEKDLVLQVSLKVGKKIEELYPGVEVLYTRTTDVFLELHERTALANKNDVDLFVSIHCDAVDNSSAKGCGSFVIGPAKTSANLKLAQRENATMLKEKDYEKNYSGFDPYSPESYIEMSLRQNTHMSQSLNFAQLVQDEFRNGAKRIDRGVKQAPYWVISFTTMPSVLVELGFTTNKEEEDFLRSADGQKKMSNAIVNAFGKYKKNMEASQKEQISIPVVREEVVMDKPKEIVTEIEKPKVEVIRTSSNDSEVYFKVQIATSSSPVSIAPENFKGLSGVSEYQSGGLYKYTCGNEKSYKKAKSMMSKIKEKNYPGAFIVAFKGGERIDLADAIVY